MYSLFIFVIYPTIVCIYIYMFILHAHYITILWLVSAKNDGFPQVKLKNLDQCLDAAQPDTIGGRVTWTTCETAWTRRNAWLIFCSGPMQSQMLLGGSSHLASEL